VVNPSCSPNLKLLASAVAQILKGNPKLFGSSYSIGTRPLFSLVWDFMMGLGKPQQRGNFEVASFSRCTNIIENPKVLGSSPNPRPRPLFSQGVIL